MNKKKRTPQSKTPRRRAHSRCVVRSFSKAKTVRTDSKISFARMNDNRPAIAERIRELRRRHFGPRGKSELARRLGISLCDYEDLEKTSQPPADVLIRICELTGEDLQWLLTGVAARGTVVISGARGRHQQLLARVAQLVEESPGLASPIEAFVDLLAAGEHARGAALGALPAPPDDLAEYIPIFDSQELPDEFPPGGPGGGLLPMRQGARSRGVAESAISIVRLCEPAAASLGGAAVRAALGVNADDAALAQAAPAHLVRLPDSGGAVRNFLKAAAVRRWLPGAFGIRVPDDALMPLIAAGDTLLTSLDAAPELGVATICRFRSGETRFRVWLGESDGLVHLGRPSDGAQEREPREDVRWSLGVLYRVTAA